MGGDLGLVLEPKLISSVLGSDLIVISSWNNALAFSSIERETGLFTVFKEIKVMRDASSLFVSENSILLCGTDEYGGKSQQVAAMLDLKGNLRWAYSFETQAKC